MSINEDLLFKKIGQRLKEKRKEGKLTQTELAKAAGIRRTSLTNLEAGRQKVPLPVIYQICAELGVEIKEILPPIDDVSKEGIEIGGRSQFVPSKSAKVIRKYSKVD